MLNETEKQGEFGEKKNAFARGLGELQPWGLTRNPPQVPSALHQPLSLQNTDNSGQLCGFSLARWEKTHIHFPFVIKSIVFALEQV